MHTLRILEVVEIAVKELVEIFVITPILIDREPENPVVTITQVDVYKKMYYIYIYIYIRKQQEERIRSALDMLNHQALIRHSGIMLTTQENIFIDRFNSVSGFYSITEGDGIYLWQYHNKQQIYEYSELPGTRGSRFGKGMTNSEGTYMLAGSVEEDVKIFNLTISNQHPLPNPLLKTYPHTQNVTSCFRLGTTLEGICIDYNGLAEKYNLETLEKSAKTFYNWETAAGEASNYVKPRFHSGVTSNDFVVILGTDNGLLYLLDNEGNEIKVYKFTANTKPIYQITEVYTNLILTANGLSGCYLHNITKPTLLENITESTVPHTTSLLLMETNYDYRSIIVLNRTGYFAIGGGVSTGDKPGGFIYIYELNELTLHPHYKKSKTGIPHDDCLIHALKVFPQAIIMAGGTHCSHICLWNYLADPHQEPFCWESIGDISDFVPIPS